jgi:hypothetical protein
VFLTRQTVLIVPAAPSCVAILTAAVRSAQSGGAGVDETVEVVWFVVVDCVSWPVEVEGWDPCPLGTGPASWAPPLLHPAARAVTAMAAKRSLVMGSIVRWRRNPLGPRP